MINENDSKSKRITITLPNMFYEAITREAARTGHKVAGLCTWLLSLKAQEFIEEEKKEGK